MSLAMQWQIQSHFEVRSDRAPTHDAELRSCPLTASTVYPRRTEDGGLLLAVVLAAAPFGQHSIRRGPGQRHRRADIDTSAVWEAVHAEAPAIPLYEDGNHPTVYGSDLSALMIYGFLSGGPIDAVTWLPPGGAAEKPAAVGTSPQG